MPEGTERLAGVAVSPTVSSPNWCRIAMAKWSRSAARNMTANRIWRQSPARRWSNTLSI